ncbi:MAG: hypothetical protein GX591_00920 [Planctomycetes bacterium]|nr:hypothetical protein [Planctomycetota bacterium]
MSLAGADISAAVAVPDASAGAEATWSPFSAADLSTSTPVMPCLDPSQAVSDAPADPGVLRADPPSAALCLATLCGLGAWQIGKSFRRINLAYVPEWYHTGGPSRIGPATPLDPSFAVLPVDAVSDPSLRDGVGERHVVHVGRLRQQYFASIRCPRAPPVWG